MAAMDFSFCGMEGTFMVVNLGAVSSVVPEFVVEDEVEAGFWVEVDAGF